MLREAGSTGGCEGREALGYADLRGVGARTIDGRSGHGDGRARGDGGECSVVLQHDERIVQMHVVSQRPRAIQAGCTRRDDHARRAAEQRQPCNHLNRRKPADRCGWLTTPEHQRRTRAGAPRRWRRGTPRRGGPFCPRHAIGNAERPLAPSHHAAMTVGPAGQAPRAWTAPDEAAGIKTSRACVLRGGAHRHDALRIDRLRVQRFDDRPQPRGADRAGSPEIDEVQRHYRSCARWRGAWSEPPSGRSSCS